MTLMARAGAGALVSKSTHAGLPLAYVITAVFARDLPALAIVGFAFGAIVASATTACCAVWIAAWRGWIRSSSYRNDIDRVIERGANNEPSDRVVAAQNRAWDALDRGSIGWTDPWPRAPVPARLVVASIAAWSVLACSGRLS